MTPKSLTKRIFRKRATPKAQEVAVEFYETLAELPFLLFERCMVHEDYSVLIKPGSATTVGAEACRERWFKLYSDYCEATGERGAVKFFKLQCSISALSARIEKCVSLLELLQKSRSPRLEHLLSIELRNLSFAHQDAEQYARSLTLAESKIKTLVFRLNELIGERDQLLPKSGTKITEQYFTDILCECAKLEGYRIAKKDISALDYCSFVKRLMAESERAKNLKPRKR